MAVIPPSDSDHLLGPEDLVRDVRQLPAAPEVLPKLMRLLQDANSSMENVVNLIRIDPGTAARVLQISNSAFYSKGTRCLTFEESVNRVGYIKIYELVAFAVSSQLLLQPLQSYQMGTTELWQRSVSCAIGAEVLSLNTAADVEGAYTIGLLHAVGLVVVNTWAKEKGREFHLASAGLPLETTEAEKKSIGFTNANVAAALMKAWGFPTKIIEPIRWQYAPRFAGGNLKTACLLGAAKWLGYSARLEEGAPLPPLPDKFILETLRLDVEVLKSKVPEVKEGFVRANQLLLDDPAAHDDHHGGI